MISLRCFRALSLFLVSGFTIAPGNPTFAARQPNIVYIMSDDQRWDALGIAGNSHVKTPNLDRMAREGQWFREATIQTPTCSASRAAILTGLPPARNGWYSNQQQRRDVVSPHGFDQYNLLPREMAKAGYRTAFVGKWHLSADPWNCGFQSIGHWMEAGAGSYRNPRLSNGPRRDSQAVQGFTQNIFADDAIEVLKAAAHPETTQPLFLWLAFTATHAPFGQNPKPESGMYKDATSKDLAPSTYYDMPGKAVKGKQSWQRYYESITALDSQIGRIINTIENSSLADNTLVVFIGDNGFMMGRRNLHGKYVPYDDALRVPLVMWGPDSVIGARGTTVTASVNSLDLPPTFVSLAGAKPPQDWVGRDLSPVLKDGGVHAITASVSSYPDHSKKLAHVDAYRVIRTGEYKLIEWHPGSGKSPELYDLTADPAEDKNLFDQPEVADVQSSLTRQLNEYRHKAKDDQWDMKGPVVDFQTLLPDGTFAENRAEAKKVKTGQAGTKRKNKPMGREQ